MVNMNRAYALMFLVLAVSGTPAVDGGLLGVEHGQMIELDHTAMRDCGVASGFLHRLETQKIESYEG